GVDALNRESWNPLFLSAGCFLKHFRFRDLLAQATLGVPSWPNPCDPMQQVPATEPRFVHARPALDWSPIADARAPAWSGLDPAEVAVGAPGSPVQGAQFRGACGVALAWMRGTNFPPPWDDTLFVADHAMGWMQSIAVDAAGAPRTLRMFAGAPHAGSPVGGAVDPVSGVLYYVDYWVSGDEAVRKLEFVANLPPSANASPAVSYGPTPLAVALSAAGSSDPEGLPLAYHWDFGDGTTSTDRDPVHVYEQLEDVTLQANFVGRIFQLVPPTPQGTGNPDPEVLRDGDRPPVGNYEDWRQFDTFHNGDQGNEDWIGYALPAPRELAGLTFQEGRHFADGGWFRTSLSVEVGDGTTWTPVTALTVAPAYPANNGVSYETFELRFQPVAATHVRLIGTPGGSSGYVSLGELRLLATPVGGIHPARRDVVLTVRDAYNATATASVLVSLDNTPPQVAITSPLHGSAYGTLTPTVVPLTASVSDAEHAPAQLVCAWQTILHHDDHVHAEPVDASCSSTTQFEPLGCDGNSYFYEVRLVVTDAAGLATQAAVFVHPDCCMSDGPPHYCLFCSGDGSGTPCPCGAGLGGNGCPNSVNVDGGHLQARGAAQVGADTFVLEASGLPNAFVLFFQGSDQEQGGAGSALGDGLLCLSGNLMRLRTKPVVGSIARYPEPGDPLVSVRGQIPATGGTRYYQAWYRNAANWCGPATFNTTNGVRATWMP
ncbi:MAG: hypothetical protein HZA53_03480, partial [Planctomycetes bacterium]|nr:hypothetical protein [Planctomycetota bacterium]